MATPTLTDQDEDMTAEGVDTPARARVLVVAATGPLLAGYAAVAALLALVTAIASRADFSTGGVLAAALPGWLAAHQVPIGIDGAQLGVLPLLPTLLVMLLVFRTASGAAERLDAGPRDAGRVVLAVVVAHACAGLVAALAVSGSLLTVDPLAGLYYPALVSGVAAGVGVLRRSGLPTWARERVDPLALRGVRVGLMAVAALLAVGAVVVVIGLATSFGTARAMFGQDGAGSGVGMLLLSVGYLPNAAVAGTAFIAGPGFALGTVSFGPLGMAGGPLPALPLLAALPDSYAPWWPVLVLLPLGIGVASGLLLREVADEPVARLRVVAVAAVVVAVVFAVLAASAGGPLGGGPFDPVDLRAPLLSVALVALVAVPAGLVSWFGGPRPERVAAEPEDTEESPVDAEPDDEDAPEDEDTDDGDDEPTEGDDEHSTDAPDRAAEEDRPGRS